jgi:hypothetical protein
MPVTKPPSRRSIRFVITLILLAKHLRERVNKHYTKHSLSYILLILLVSTSIFMGAIHLFVSQSSSPQFLPVFFVPFTILQDVLPNPLFLF